MKKRSGVVRSQKWVFPSHPYEGESRLAPRKRSYPTGMYANMLIQDVTLGIIPFRDASGEYKINVVPATSGSKMGRDIAVALNPRDYPRGLTEALGDFVREAAGGILTNGGAAFEIVYLSEPTGKTIGFEFIRIPFSQLIQIGGEYYQNVPNTTGASHDIATRVTLETENVVLMELPRHLKREIGEFWGPLHVLGDSIMPEFVLESMSRRDTSVPYDAKEHIRSRSLALASTVKSVGWNGRGSLQEFTTEYYYLHRELVFEGLKIELRNSILDRINEALKRVGKKLGFEAKLEIEGLPGLDDVRRAQEHLTAGDQSFEGIFRPFRRV